uniref:Uncharacterized protein n=1 Tax=Tetraselmis sp. GSL018 TaxID=582737 RepID=A0A061RIS1_9CHLO
MATKNLSQVFLLKHRLRDKAQLSIVAVAVLAIFVFAQLLCRNHLEEIEKSNRQIEDSHYSLRKFLKDGRYTLASNLVRLGAVVEPEAVEKHLPSRGYIRKALEKSREQLQKNTAEQQELQAYYENELRRLRKIVDDENDILKDVFGADSDWVQLK